MQLKVLRLFRYQLGNKVELVQPGTYDVPRELSKELAAKIRRYGKAEVIGKKAPENKIVTAAESKAKVEKVRSRRTRAKSKR